MNEPDPPLQNTGHLAYRGPWFDSPFFEQLLEASPADEERKAQARKLRQDGYLILEDFFEPELIDRVVGSYDWLFDPGTSFDAPPRVLRALASDPERRQDAWAVCEPARELACHERVLGLLRFLFGREPIPFQTLNFLSGTEQSLHSDAFHFSTLPSGYVCGVWVALEDVTLENGALMYVKGSHRYPAFELHDLGLSAEQPERGLGPNYTAYEKFIQALVEARGSKAEPFLCKKGTTFVWPANLLHGGSPILDRTTTRKSQVTHYYFEDCVYYTPLHSDMALGELFLRTIHDIRTEEVVPHRLNGQELRVERAGNLGEGLFRITREGGGEKRWPTYDDERARMEGHIATLEGQVQNLQKDVPGLEAHIEDLEQELARLRSGRLFRLTGAVKDFIQGRPRRS